MKNKACISFIAVLATFLMVAGSIQAGPISTTSHIKSPQTTTISFQCSLPQINEENGFSTVQLKEATGSRNIPGEPVLPVIMKTLEFPMGTHILDVQCTLGDTTTHQLAQKIIPAATPVVDDKQPLQQPVPDQNIYSSDQPFPATWYAYRLTGGLNSENILTTFLTIQINPVRYNPVTDSLQSLSDISLTITYKTPDHSLTPLKTTYDMVIIAYDPYAPLLKQLVNHKISHGVQTKLVTMSDIKKGTYFPVEGKTIQEKIKYFIKNAKEIWNVTYVMLVGNYRQVPVQYTYLETDTGGKYQELKFATDLYYADLYDANGSFCSWDSNHNGKCGEWPYPESHGPVDAVDLVPDVHLAREACMFKAEVQTIVQKIITYENTTAGKDWFKTLIGVGGDTFPKSDEGGTNYSEGEVCTGAAMQIMSGFTGIKLWMSLGNLTTKSILKQADKGCGFLYFSGHGNPRSWATHKNGDYKNWTGKFQNKDMYQLKNKNMYPIMIVGGCHNSEVDVTPLRFIEGLLKEGMDYFNASHIPIGSYYLYNWVPQCWSWVFVSAPNGAIASLGSVGFGCVSIGDANHDGIPDCIQGYDGWLETQFFKLYHDDHIDILGQTYDQTVTNYVHTFPVDTNRYDAKVLETHILFGDPSLKIGGYA
jgi:hypothetical protein